MIYLQQFSFPSIGEENVFFMNEKRTCFDTFYPFQTICYKAVRLLEFDPITIICGGNGSGKSTILNIIAEKLKLQRNSLFNRSSFFEDYLNLCDYKTEYKITDNSRVITSDDVFDYMLNIRSLNSGIDSEREKMLSQYVTDKWSQFKLSSLKDYETLKRVNRARQKTQSKYIREFVNDNVRERSNGENAFKYFVEKISENGLFLLDEPENSLSPERQLELKKLIEDSARFFHCQFIIATHSPFLLSIKNAKIYDLDGETIKTSKWTELNNVRAYYKFFKENEVEFE